jgi:hypothetical protein
LANVIGTIMLPKFSKTQMLAIEKPSTGMLIYHTDDQTMVELDIMDEIFSDIMNL